MKKLMLLGVLGCASGGSGGLETERYSGQTLDSEYSVDVFEVYSNGFCISREVTLKEGSGLHLSPNHVSHVRAIDRNCDDSFESFYFRYNQDRGVNRAMLEGDILNAYYNLRFER